MSKLKADREVEELAEVRRRLLGSDDSDGSDDSNPSHDGVAAKRDRTQNASTSVASSCDVSTSSSTLTAAGCTPSSHIILSEEGVAIIGAVTRRFTSLSELARARSSEDDGKALREPRYEGPTCSESDIGKRLSDSVWPGPLRLERRDVMTAPFLPMGWVFELSNSNSSLGGLGGSEGTGSLFQNPSGFVSTSYTVWCCTSHILASCVSIIITFGSNMEGCAELMMCRPREGRGLNRPLA